MVAALLAAAPFDRPTALAVHRYLAARAVHRWAHLPDLWLGRRGGLTDRGVDHAVRHRGRLAGLPNLHPQRLRHTYVQQYLADGGTGRELMRLVGWKSRQLLGRYRTGALAERPQAEWLRPRRPAAGRARLRTGSYRNATRADGHSSARVGTLRTIDLQDAHCGVRLMLIGRVHPPRTAQCCSTVVRSSSISTGFER
jgi:hypothetical protein